MSKQKAISWSPNGKKQPLGEGKYIVVQKVPQQSHILMVKS